MPQVRRDLKQVWYDTAASPLLYPTAGIFNLALQAVDHRKLLYGSDYPLRLYPRRQTEPDFGPFIAEIDQLGLAEDIYNDIMGRNMARLLGLLEIPPGAGGAPPPAGTRRAPPASERGEGVSSPPEIKGFMAVKLVAATWPETQAVFEKFNIPWQDSPVPAWEPISQAAAARGWGPLDQQRLLETLNEIIQARSSQG
jgi:hypothetical protein